MGIRVNTSNLLSNKILTLFLNQELKWPKDKYTEIVVDLFNTPIGVLNKRSRLRFFSKYEQTQILNFFKMSNRKRKELLKELTKEAENK